MSTTPHDAESTAKLDDAHQAEVDGDVDLAIEIWRSVAEALPGDCDARPAYRSIARLSLKSGQVDVAEKWARQGLDRYPGDAVLLLRHAQSAERRGDWRVALERFRALVAAHPEHEIGRLRGAECLVQLGLDDQADEAYAAIVRDHADLLPAIHGYARCAVRRNDHQEAFRRWGLALRVDSTNLRALQGQAQAHLSLGAFEQAEDLYAQLVDLYPDLPAGYFGIAQVALRRRDWQSAITLWRSAHDRFPGDIVPYLRLAGCLMELGELDEAGQVVERACASFAADHRPFIARARLAWARHDYDAAAAEHSAIRSRFASSAEALFELGRDARAARGVDLDTLAATFEEVLAIDPERVDAHVMLGDCRRLSGRFTEARAILHEVLRRTPATPVALLLLAQVESIAGDGDIAEQLFLELAATENGSGTRASALLQLSQLRLQSARPDDADRCLDQVEAIGERDAAVEAATAAVLGQVRALVRRYAEDPAALDEMQRALATERSKSTDTFLEGLLEMAGRRSDYLPASLLAAQRLNWYGRFDEFSGDVERPASPEPRIPRRIIQYWDSPDVPTDIQKAMRTWRNDYPDWEHSVYDDRRGVEFLEERYGSAFVDAYRSCHHPAMRSDFLRHTNLFAFGGVYVDADEVCRRRIEIPPAVDLVVRFQNLALIVEFLPGFFGVSAGHPMLADLVDEMVDRVTNRVDDNHWFSVGPGLFTKHVVRHLGRSGAPDRGAEERRSVLVLMQSDYGRLAFTPRFAYKATAMNWLKAQHGPPSD